MILDRDEAKVLVKKVLSYSKADSASVSVYGSNSNNLRFALNTVSTCGAIDAISANITSNFGKKSGSVTVTSIDDEMLEKGVRQSEEIAKLTPDNEEFMPPLEKQNGYLEVKEFFEDTDKLTPQDISNSVAYTINKSIDKGLSAAGFFEKSSEFSAIGNTNDLFAYHKDTSAGFASTIRTIDGRGSSKIDRSYADISKLNIKKFSDTVIDRAVLSKDPVRHEPGKYVTILDHSAVSDMVDNLIGFMSRRSADEGRSFFSDKEKGSKIGNKILNSKVNIYSDPQDKDAPGRPYSGDGFPVGRTEWYSEGILKNLFSNRYWANKKGSEYVPYPSNVIMSGGNKTVDELIASTESGVFVTRLWYIRTVDQRQILLTGLTRDGVFLIENGKITKSINNYRFNESPLNILNNIIDMSASEKVVGSETGDTKIVVPALKISEFNFSTISDAV
ncbi:MAG: metallopeptidase TldD-related protein [bacterium]|nr:metallopeptidase TldD-related protein [bacterium]